MSDVVIRYGPKTDAYYERSRKVFCWPTGDENRPVLNLGSGIVEIGVDGNKFVNCASHVGVMNTGQCPEEVVSAVAEQNNYLSACLTSDWQFCCIHKRGSLAGQEVSPARLAEELVRIAPVPFPKIVIPEVSGATAVNAAVKWALATYLDKTATFPTRKKLAAFEYAFHGRHGAALDLSSSKFIHKLLHVNGFDVARLPFPAKGTIISYPEYAERIKLILDSDRYKDQVAALFVEIVQGEGGINLPDLKAMSILHREIEVRGIRFVADEIQTGLGRCGRMFASDYLGFDPDAIVLSKALGAGYPIGAVVARSDILPHGFPAGAHSGTMPWAPASVAAALANLQMIRERRLAENSMEMGAYLLKRLKKLIWAHDVGRDIVRDIDGMGLMIRVYCRSKEAANILVNAAMSQKPGLILIEAGEKTIRFMPPLIVTKEKIDLVVEIFDKALSKISA